MGRKTHDDQDQAVDIGQLMYLLLEVKMHKLWPKKLSSSYSQNPKHVTQVRNRSSQEHIGIFTQAFPNRLSLILITSGFVSSLAI